MIKKKFLLMPAYPPSDFADRINKSIKEFPRYSNTIPGDIIEIDGAKYELLEITDYHYKFRSLVDYTMYVFSVEDLYFNNVIYSPAITKVFTDMMDCSIDECWTSIFNNDFSAIMNPDLWKNVPIHPKGPSVDVTVSDLVHPCRYLTEYIGIEGTNTFGRTYTDIEYSWIAHRVHEGKIIDEIPHMKRSEHESFYETLESTLKHMMDGFELAYDFVKGYDPSTSFIEDYEILASDTCASSCTSLPTALPKKLQFYIKVVDMMIPSELSYNGVWHLEGVPEEHIIATGLCYLPYEIKTEDSDSKIDISIAFKRVMTKREAERLYYSIGQGEPYLHSYLNKTLMPLGTHHIDDKNIIVFPNTHVHRVQGFGADSRDIHRKFIAFFLVDPSKEVPYYDGLPTDSIIETMTMKDGNTEYAEELISNMEHRRTAKSSLTPTHIEFCEH